MARPTDAELGELLRETFAEREHLADGSLLTDSVRPDDHLPTARARRATVLLAAAAVLAVVAGVLYGVTRVGATAPEPPAATPTVRTATDDAQIWAASLDTLLTRFLRPRTVSWRSVIVLDLSDVGKKHARKGPPISASQRTMMASLVRTPLQFRGEMSPAPPTCQDARVGVAEVSDIVDKGGYVVVELSLFHDCKQRLDAKYRVERRGNSWVVTQALSLHAQGW